MVYGKLHGSFEGHRLGTEKNMETYLAFRVSKVVGYDSGISQHDVKNMLRFAGSRNSTFPRH